MYHFWPSKYKHECHYPFVFSTKSLRCENYTDVDCGSRFLPTWACKYDHWHCKVMSINDIFYKSDCIFSILIHRVLGDILRFLQGNLITISVFKILKIYNNPTKKIDKRDQKLNWWKIWNDDPQIATIMESGPQYIYFLQSFVFSRENYMLSSVLSVLLC